MRIGVVGLGKVGLPFALVLADAWHDVVGFDVNPGAVRDRLGDSGDHGELRLGQLVASVDLPLADRVEDLVGCDMVFVVVQTPHAPEYGGQQPMPQEARDFDYTYLQDALQGLNEAANDRTQALPTVIVSTVMPGTTTRLAREVPNLRVAYSPVFISLGTVVPDLQEPDFVLIGSTDTELVAQVEAVWREVHDKPVYRCTVESAELLKVSLNCMISMKIMFANALMELSAATGADVDEVTDGLALSTKATSAAYLHAGLGDGGPCRPRDAVAMSWLGERHSLSFDPFGWLTRGREAQSSWLAGQVRRAALTYGLPVFLLGRTYKPGSRIVDGSAAILLNHDLGAPSWDPMLDGPPPVWEEPRVFVVGTRHPEFRDLRFPPGSVVVDPFGYLEPQLDVTYIPVGRKI